MGYSSKGKPEKTKVDRDRWVCMCRGWSKPYLLESQRGGGTVAVGLGGVGK